MKKLVSWVSVLALFVAACGGRVEEASLFEGDWTLATTTCAPALAAQSHVELSIREVTAHAILRFDDGCVVRAESRVKMLSSLSFEMLAPSSISCSECASCEGFAFSKTEGRVEDESLVLLGEHCEERLVKVR